tara:strand:- start:1267 stop:1386 length:120 start_codon:yes stop_codon:yes gene_type:complete
MLIKIKISKQITKIKTATVKNLSVSAVIKPSGPVKTKIT